jgi:hypothetical protein
MPFNLPCNIRESAYTITKAYEKADTLKDTIHKECGKAKE